MLLFLFLFAFFQSTATIDQNLLMTEPMIESEIGNRIYIAILATALLSGIAHYTCTFGIKCENFEKPQCWAILISENSYTSSMYLSADNEARLIIFTILFYMVFNMCAYLSTVALLNNPPFVNCIKTRRDILKTVIGIELVKILCCNLPGYAILSSISLPAAEGWLLGALVGIPSLAISIIMMKWFLTNQNNRSNAIELQT